MIIHSKIDLWDQKNEIPCYKNSCLKRPFKQKIIFAKDFYYCFLDVFNEPSNTG